jgi:putative peptidoglycan lipid II flippase
MAQYFGRNLVTDSFIQAQTLSTVVYDLLVSGMVGAALIPTLSRLAVRDDMDEFWRVANAVFAIGALVLAVIVGAMELLAPVLVHVMSGGYDAPTLARETLLARLMIPTVWLMGLSAAATAVLYSLHRYRLPALAIACINLGVIAGMLAFHRLGIVSAAGGLLVGATAQLLLQALALRQARMPFHPRLDWRQPEVVHIGKLYLPVAAGFLMSSVVVGGERHLYSLAAPGGLSAAQYATRLLQVPLGLVSTAVSMAILPTISRYAERSEWSAYRRMVAIGLNVSVLLTLPVTAALAVLAVPVVDLLFVHGAFRPDDAQATIIAFWLFAPQLPFAAADQILINAFYAMHDTRTPNAVYFVVAVIWAAVAIPGVMLYNWPALVAANTIQNCAHAVILFALLLRRHPAIIAEGLTGAWLRGLGATALMAGVCWLIATGLRHELGSGRLIDLVTIILAGGGGALAYVLVMWLTGKDEVALLRQSLRRSPP